MTEERLAHVISVPESLLPAVGHKPLVAHPNGSVHVPHSVSFTAVAPDGIDRTNRLVQATDAPQTAQITPHARTEQLPTH